MNDTDPADTPSLLSFVYALHASSPVLCLVGAGLSAPSGLSAWRSTNDPQAIATLKEFAFPKTFQSHPDVVWSYYGARLLDSLNAKPNAAHHAVAALARWNEMWVIVNQNVDGLLERTEHAPSTLLSIHGSLKTVRCTACDYEITVEDINDVPFLLPMTITDDHRSDPRDAVTSHPNTRDLPYCPNSTDILRKGVVWFGERLAAGAPDRVDEFLADDNVDIVVVVGTSLGVFPAAEWVHTARARGARVAVFDEAGDHEMVDELGKAYWFFQGDGAVILPLLVGMVRQEEAI